MMLQVVPQERIQTLETLQPGLNSPLPGVLGGEGVLS